MCYEYHKDLPEVKYIIKILLGKQEAGKVQKAWRLSKFPGCAHCSVSMEQEKNPLEGSSGQESILIYFA